MTSTTLVDRAPTAPMMPSWRRRPVPLAAGLVLLAGGAALAWSGGALALVGVGLAALAPVTALRARRPGADRPVAAGTVAPGTAEPAAPPVDPAPLATAPGRGASAMLAGVVPVWARQLEATRQTADEGLSHLLAAFGTMNEPIDALLGGLEGASGPVSTSAVVEATAPELLALRACSQRAFDQRDAALAELNHCAAGLTRLDELARSAREMARHTRLIAFNASIEANRHSSTDQGSLAVAKEMRTLADRLGGTAQAIAGLVHELSARVEGVCRTQIVGGTTPQQLEIELDLRAREALRAMLGHVGGLLRSSSTVADAAQALRAQLDEAFVHFQFGDRVSQMLSIVANDMTQLVQWTATHPDAGPNDAAQWLARLEASYTMEEQRSEHHGNVHIDRGSEVEFF